MLNWWQVLLFPFALLYDLVTRFSNHLYNIGYKKSFGFQVNVISVGNISVGGTGKTPLVDYLITYFLNQGKSVATLSRGYGRKTKGFRICNESDDALTVGDEPFTYYENHRNKILVTVGENRAVAVPFILAKKPDIDVILMDDAFQHRSIRPSFSILLTTQKRPFWYDFLLPSGRNRESRSGARRADAIVMTKSERKEEGHFAKRIGKPFFQTDIGYGDPVFFYGGEMRGKVVVVTGLAQNSIFVDYVKNHFEISKSFEFKDHHEYCKADVKKLVVQLNGCTLLTTHKDAVKLREFEQLGAYDCAYIPIQVNFLSGEERFLRMIDESLKDYTVNH